MGPLIEPAVIFADDRTGAMETGGICARTGVPVLVGTGSVDRAWLGHQVIDLGSRHLAPVEAGERLSTAATGVAGSMLLKIDSTLRGNWAHEAVALVGATGHPMMLVPAFPALGRTCRDGQVLVGGSPVHSGHAARDARRGIGSSRPAEYLRRAGRFSVCEAHHQDALTEWLAAPTSTFLVCDAADDRALRQMGDAWRCTRDVLFGGTAGSIGAAVATGALAPSPSLMPPGPLLVVCGSLHPVARSQVEALRGRGVKILGPGCQPDEITGALRSGLAVVQSDHADGRPVSDVAAAATSALLAGCVRPLVASGLVAALLIIGGDTAAALLGDGPMLVHGSVAPGMPVGRRADGSGPVVVTRAGGFGSTASLVELFSDRLPT